MRTITWRVHFNSPPIEVYRFISTADGRKHFWAESAQADPGNQEITFRFSNGAELRSRIISADPGNEFRLTYFDGSTVTFRLADDGRGGTDLVLTEEGAKDWEENRAGWVTVLLSLKAAVDHGVDLRNHDPERSWERGYVDV